MSKNVKVDEAIKDAQEAMREAEEVEKVEGDAVLDEKSGKILSFLHHKKKEQKDGEDENKKSGKGKKILTGIGIGVGVLGAFFLGEKEGEKKTYKRLAKAENEGLLSIECNSEGLNSTEETIE